MDKGKAILSYFPQKIRQYFAFISDKDWLSINEIVFINGQAILLQKNGKRTYISSDSYTTDIKTAYKACSDDIGKIYELITKSSVYAYNRFITQGFITLDFGHRVGIVGECVMDDKRIISTKNINALSFRIAHETSSNIDLIYSDIYNKSIFNTIIISPPSCGKTTLLRAIAKRLSCRQSDGFIPKCAIVDERYELSACIDGISSMNTGTSSVIISGCPKNIAIPMLVRSMSPDVIFTDELATEDDIYAIKYASASGCKIIASVHGFDENNNELKYFNIDGLFHNKIILSNKNGPGTIEKIVKGDKYDY